MDAGICVFKILHLSWEQYDLIIYKQNFYAITSANLLKIHVSPGFSAHPATVAVNML